MYELMWAGEGRTQYSIRVVSLTELMADFVKSTYTDDMYKISSIKRPVPIMYKWHADKKVHTLMGSWAFNWDLTRTEPYEVSSEIQCEVDYTQRGGLYKYIWWA